MKQYPFVPSSRVVREMLSLADVDVSRVTTATWTLRQCCAAVTWAAAVHLRASDNPVRVPPRPKFLPKAGGAT